MTIRVMVTGALGKMGRETMKAIENAEGMKLVGAVDPKGDNHKKSDVTGNIENDFALDTNLKSCIDKCQPQVMVDFTNPKVVYSNAEIALNNKINCVIGTTGLSDAEIFELKELAVANSVAIAIIPNFAIGAVLMMQFAARAAKFLPQAEIIELHHDQKMDSPSGTATSTARMIADARVEVPRKMEGEIEKIPGARGANVDEVHIHSVRLQGLIAHQEVIFGGLGQGLTIRHDSYDRISFMPGVIMAVRGIIGKTGLVYGLEKFMD